MFDVFLFDIKPDILSVLGSCLIVGSSLLLKVVKNEDKNEDEKEE